MVKVLPSSFLYHEQAIMYVPKHLIDFMEEQYGDNFIANQVECIKKLLAITAGSSLILVTSKSYLDQLYELIKPYLEEQRINLYKQGGRPVMKRVLISIDWDYFIGAKKATVWSLRENYRNCYLRWYREYLQSPRIMFLYTLLPELKNFWNILGRHYHFNPSTLLFVSESHKYSYYLSQILDCQKVLNFDAHADLGYSGFAGVGAYTHCANWLGRLVNTARLNEAEIVYSPYTHEKAADFNDFLKRGVAIHFTRLEKLEEQPQNEVVAGIHVCRSGAWTPPWYDQQLYRLINTSGLRRRKGFVKPRLWRPEQLTYAQKIDLLLCS